MTLTLNELARFPSLGELERAAERGYCDPCGSGFSPPRRCPRCPPGAECARCVQPEGRLMTRSECEDLKREILCVERRKLAPPAPLPLSPPLRPSVTASWSVATPTPSREEHEARMAAIASETRLAELRAKLEARRAEAKARQEIAWRRARPQRSEPMPAPRARPRRTRPIWPWFAAGAVVVILLKKG